MKELVDAYNAMVDSFYELSAMMDFLKVVIIVIGIGVVFIAVMNCALFSKYKKQEKLLKELASIIESWDDYEDEDETDLN